MTPYRGPTTAEAERAMLETQAGGEGSLANMMATAFAPDNRFVGQNHNQGAYLPTIARWNANRRADERGVSQPSLADQLRFLLSVMGGG